jgi:hypothetical protein
MGQFIWVRNESTGQERTMTKTSFAYHEGKRKTGANHLRPKFTFLREVEEPKSEIQLAKERLIAEKAAREQAAADEQTVPQERVKKAGRPAKTNEQAQ